jgi:hypothetical protein
VPEASFGKQNSLSSNHKLSKTPVFTRRITTTTTLEINNNNMSSDTVKNAGSKKTLAEIREKRTAQNKNLVAAAEGGAVGEKEMFTRYTGRSWADDEGTPNPQSLSADVAEFTDLYWRYQGTNNVSLKHKFLLRMGEIRRNAVKNNETLSHWFGAYVKPVSPVPAALTAAQVLTLLEHFRPEQMASNTYGLKQEFNYSQTSVTPHDKTLWLLCQDPANRPIVREVLRWVFVTPTYMNMLKRMVEATKEKPAWDKISKFFKPAEDAVVLRSELRRMNDLPRWGAVQLDEKKSPGYPYTVMPSEKPNVPISSVRQVAMMTRNINGKEVPMIDHDVKSAIAYLLEPKKNQEFDERLLFYSLQSGNVKHVLREEVGEKPNRPIFASPLVLRLIQGAVSQPFMANWKHPGNLVGDSFAYGKTAEILSKILGLPKPDLSNVSDRKTDLRKVFEKILELVELVPAGAPYRKGIMKLKLRKGALAAPDVSQYDLNMRKEFMDSFAKYTEGVLPDLDSLLVLSQSPDEKEKNTAEIREMLKKKTRAKLNSWKKLLEKTHRIDANAVVVTNNKIKFNLGPGRNPSGTMWVTTRNTFVKLLSEEMANRAVFEKLHPNRDYTSLPEDVKAITAAGDDSTIYMVFPGDGDQVKRGQKHMEVRAEVMKQIGFTYKETTLTVTDVISDLEVLGRNILALVDANDSDNFLGFIAVRSELKTWLSIVYPKHMPAETFSPDQYAMSRVISAIDETGIAFPALESKCRKIYDVLSNGKSLKPWHDGSQDLYFEVPVASEPRSYPELVQLHTGRHPASALKFTEDSSGDSAEDLANADELEEVGVAVTSVKTAVAVAKKNKGKTLKREKEVKPKEEVAELATDLD